MGKRIDLQEELQNLIGRRRDGKQNVYFQPPESIKMVYPCIVYNRTAGDTEYGNNMPYKFVNQYTLTYIDTDPDSKMIEKIAMAFPTIRMARTFVSDGLNHYVYDLYY